jgi:hypothetical protein
MLIFNGVGLQIRHNCRVRRRVRRRVSRRVEKEN